MKYSTGANIAYYKALKGVSFFSEVVSNLQVSIDKIVTPLYFGNKTVMTPDPHLTSLPPKQAKIVLKSVFLNKMITLNRFIRFVCKSKQ